MFEVTIIPGRVMPADETAQWKAKIISQTGNIGDMLLKIREEKGWETAGFKSFRDFCGSLDEAMALGKAYYLTDVADVNRSLSSSVGRQIALPITHALMLKDLDPAQRLQAFKEATAGGKNDVTAKAFERAARHASPTTTKGKKKKKLEENKGFSKEDLDNDKELAMAFVALGVWGTPDVKAIKQGALSLKRADILFLAKLPSNKLMEIQDLIMGNGWTPQQAMKFVSTMADRYSTVEDLQNYALATKGKYFTADIEGFTITCKANRAAQRR